MVLIRRMALPVLSAAVLALASCEGVREPSLPPPPYIGPAQSAPKVPPPPDMPPTPPPPPARALAPEGPIDLTLSDAVVQCLENNRQLRVVRVNPEIVRTIEDVQRAAFDPLLTAGLSQQWQMEQNASPTGPTQGTNAEMSAAAGVQQYAPTGTLIELAASSLVNRTWPGQDPLSSTRLGLSVTQALLRGYGIEPNLASLRQARVDTQASEYELRGFVLQLVASTEAAYWNYVLAERQIAIFTDSMRLAEQQLNETQERIRVGTLAKTELAAAQAEVALRKEQLINATSRRDEGRLRLLRFINPPGGFDRTVRLLEGPVVRDVDFGSREGRIRTAQRLRPEMNQALLALRRNELEVVKTRNGALPRLDVFIILGKTGYAQSFENTFEGLQNHNYDATAGATFEFPPLNRSAEAKLQRSALARNQARDAIENLSQLIELDVRAALIEVTRLREQVSATAATRALQEETLRAEMEKFRVGKSTSFLVARAQRDLVVGQAAEIEAVVNYLKSITELYRLDGTLLVRRGLEAPGEEPVEGNDGR
jgi:outer membrane protein TolC